MSSKRRIIITILCILGLILSLDLVYIYIKTSFLSDAPKSFCSISDFIDCDGVARTTHAFFLGVPLAIWGTILYLLFLFLTYVDKIREKIKLPLLNVFEHQTSYIASIGLLAFLISITLAIISIFEIQKICILCFGTYFINLFIALSAVQKNFFIEDIKNTVIDFIKGAKKYTVLFIIVCMLMAGILTFTNKTLILAPGVKVVKELNEFLKMKTNKYAIKGNELGNLEGDVQIYIYGDFMCPYCKITNIMLHKLVTEDKNIGVHHVNFPLDSVCNSTVKKTGHTGACLLARYALAAKEQGNYWGMVSAIYNKIPKKESQILETGKKIGLNPEQLYEDAYSKKINEELKNQIDKGIKEGLFATPTIVIDDIPHSDGVTYNRIKELVEQSRMRHARAEQK